MSLTIEPSTVYPTALEPLAGEARKYSTFKDFKHAFSLELKHGQYYHVTDNPNFTISQEKGPRDMSSMASGTGLDAMEPGKLMITSDLNNWTSYYGKERGYVAFIDMSQVPANKYWQVNRGFGNEFFVDDPALARVIRVLPIKEALRAARYYQDVLGKYFDNDEDLKAFYDKVRGVLPMTEKAEKRITLTADRFTVTCSLCGFLRSEESFAEALSTAQEYAKQHNSPEEKITIFDVMAHQGACQLWDVNGKCLKNKPFPQHSSAQTLDPEIMGQYPTESISYTEGNAVARARYQTREEMEPFQEYPKIKIELQESGSQAENVVALKRVAEMLRDRANLPDAGSIPEAKITAKEELPPGCKKVLPYDRQFTPEGLRLSAWPVLLVPFSMIEVPPSAIIPTDAEDEMSRRQDFDAEIWGPPIAIEYTSEIGKFTLVDLYPKPTREWSTHTVRAAKMKGYDCAHCIMSPNSAAQLQTMLQALAPADDLRKEKAVAKYPRILTQEQYERDWKPKGWNLLPIGPTASYRKEWDIWEAIRDIVQNSLDEAEAYTSGYDDDGLWIEDKGRGVGIQNFLLGPPKLKEDWARGKFGEGMKLAGLALLRLGYAVYIDTVETEVYVVFLEVEARGKVQSLHALWRDGKRTSGTRFHIIGYFGSDFKDRFSVNLPIRSRIFQAPTIIEKPFQRNNELIRHKFTTLAYGKTSRIFIRDIFMEDRTTAFSYNLWGCDLAPDRHAPKSESGMWVDIGRLWACCDKPELLEELLRLLKETEMGPNVPEETRRMTFDRWDMGSTPAKSIFQGKSYQTIMIDNKELWQRAWNKVYGEDKVLRTEANLDPAVKHLNYESVSLTSGVRYVLGDILTTDRKLVNESQEALSEVQIIKDSELNPTQLIHLKCSRDIISHMWFDKPQAIVAAVIPPASERTRTAGLYSRQLKIVYIALEQLGSMRLTVDTLTHEVAHHTSQAEDLEEAHAQAISQVAGYIVEQVARGGIDTYMADPNFRW